MSKKASGKNYVSVGEVGTNRQISKKIRRERTYYDRLMAQREAWEQGRRVMLTIPNPNKTETGRPYIRVEAQTVWGDPRGNKSVSLQSSNSENS